MRLPSFVDVCRESARRLYAKAARWRAIGYPDVADELEVEARQFEVAAAAAALGFQ